MATDEFAKLCFQAAFFGNTLFFADACSATDDTSASASDSADAVTKVLNVRSEKGITVLMVACAAAQEDVVRWLLQAAGQEYVNACDDDSNTALHFACMHETTLWCTGVYQLDLPVRDRCTRYFTRWDEEDLDEDKAKELRVCTLIAYKDDDVTCDADVPTCGEIMVSSKHKGWASNEARMRIVALLLHAGADATARSIADGNTPLHLAAIHGYDAVVARLLQLPNEEPLMKKNFYGNTPLECAVRCTTFEASRAEVIRMLAERSWRQIICQADDVELFRAACAIQPEAVVMLLWAEIQRYIEQQRCHRQAWSNVRSWGRSEWEWCCEVHMGNLEDMTQRRFSTKSCLRVLRLIQSLPSYEPSYWRHFGTMIFPAACKHNDAVLVQALLEDQVFMQYAKTTVQLEQIMVQMAESAVWAPLWWLYQQGVPVPGKVCLLAARADNWSSVRMLLQLPRTRLDGSPTVTWQESTLLDLLNIAGVNKAPIDVLQACVQHPQLHPFHRNQRQQTALHVAVMHNLPDVIDMVMQRVQHPGSDSAIQDIIGSSSACLAAAEDNSGDTAFDYCFSLINSQVTDRTCASWGERILLECAVRLIKHDAHVIGSRRQALFLPPTLAVCHCSKTQPQERLHALAVQDSKTLFFTTQLREYAPVVHAILAKRRVHPHLHHHQTASLWHIAARLQDRSCIDGILQRCATRACPGCCGCCGECDCHNIDTPDDSPVQRSPLSVAMQARNINAVLALLKHGASVAVAERNGESVLKCLLSRAHSDVEEIEDAWLSAAAAGARLPAPGDCMASLLHLALTRKYARVVLYLCEQGVRWVPISYVSARGCSSELYTSMWQVATGLSWKDVQHLTEQEQQRLWEGAVPTLCAFARVHAARRQDDSTSAARSAADIATSHDSVDMSSLLLASSSYLPLVVSFL